jgi:predicted N-acetyltransferase YhbS
MKQKKYTLKKITPRNIDAILRLDDRLISTWSRDLYLERLHSFPDLAFGMFDGKKMIGFIIGKRTSGDHVLISRLVVDTKYENQGLGTRLANKLKYSANAKMVSTIRASNIPSLRVHEHIGFTKQEPYTFYDGEPGFKLRTKKKWGY